MDSSEIKISENSQGPPLWSFDSWNPFGNPRGFKDRVAIVTDGKPWLWADLDTARLIAKVAARTEIEQMAKNKLRVPEQQSARFLLRRMTEQDYEMAYNLSLAGELNRLYHVGRQVAFYHRTACPVPEFVSELVRLRSML